MLEFSQAPSTTVARRPPGPAFFTNTYGFWQSECLRSAMPPASICHVVPHNTNINKNPQLKPDVTPVPSGRRRVAHRTRVVKRRTASLYRAVVPRTVYSIKAEIREIIMSIRQATPIAHHPQRLQRAQDSNANWALEKMNACTVRIAAEVDPAPTPPPAPARRVRNCSA